MSTQLECIPCLCRETVMIARAVTDDPVLQDAILGEALFHLAMRDPEHSPEILADDLRALIARRIGRDAPSFSRNATCPHVSPAADTYGLPSSFPS
jgi:uncharacterized protein with ATP-grasp and redox domains